MELLVVLWPGAVRALLLLVLVVIVLQMASRQAALVHLRREQRQGAAGALLLCLLGSLAGLAADMWWSVQLPPGTAPSWLPTPAGWVVVAALLIPPLVARQTRQKQIEEPLARLDERITTFEAHSVPGLAGPQVEDFRRTLRDLREDLGQMEFLLRTSWRTRLEGLRQRLDTIEAARQTDLARFQIEQELRRPEPRWEAVLQHALLCQPKALGTALLDADYGNGQAAKEWVLAHPQSDAARELAQRLAQRSPQRFDGLLEQLPNDHDSLRRRAALQARRGNVERACSIALGGADYEFHRALQSLAATGAGSAASTARAQTPRLTPSAAVSATGQPPAATT